MLSVLEFFIGDAEHGVDVFKVRGMYDGFADEAVGLVDDDFAQ